MNLDNPLKDMRDFYVQTIMENNLSIFRAYVNGFYWLKHSYYDENSRNLGYYSDLQTDLSNYFRSLVIDWLVDKKESKEIELLLQYIITNKRTNIIDDFIIKLGNDVYTLTNCIIELHILSIIQNYISIIILDNESKILYIFDNGLIYNSNKNEREINNSKFNKFFNTEIRKQCIVLRFNFINNNQIPDEIEVIYYK